MKPSARLQAGIELLDEIIVAARDNGSSADTIAARFFAGRRYAGSKDRRAIRDLVWDCIRHFGERPDTGRAAFVAMAGENAEMAGLFDGCDYGPPAIADGEPRAGGGTLPQWLLPRLSALIDATERGALLERAPLDLRVNPLKSNRDAILAEFPQAVIINSPYGVRLPTGMAIDQHPAMLNGRVDIQDMGSQLIAAACHAQPGMTVLDLCAGAGGKTLALAADMVNQGHIIASDTNRQRLDKMRPRAVRSGVEIIEARLLNPGHERDALSDLAGKCDVVLVDAPCSGSGTWRRNPETRWRINPARLEQVVAQQAKLLSIATDMVANGGHLIYAVCSLLDDEGRAQVQQFLDAHKGWTAVDPGIAHGRISGAGRILTPHHDACDGFFLARLQKL